MPQNRWQDLRTRADNVREKLWSGLRNRWVELQLARSYPAMHPTEKTGAYGERLASIYLMRKGYLILERSFRAKSGEIDLIALWRRKTIVFVEVKTWREQPENMGGPSDSVDQIKQEKISKTALIYMKRHRLLESSGRADVIEVTFDAETGQPIFRHFENAFEAVGSFQMFS